LAKVVIKKTFGEEGALAQIDNKGTWLQALRNTGTKHIVKIYKEVFHKRRPGVVETMIKTSQEFSWNIARVGFTWFNKGIDQVGLTLFIGIRLLTKSRKFTARDPIPEELLWNLSRYLALGLVVMENGNEDLDGASWDHGLVHYDLKAANSRSTQNTYPDFQSADRNSSHFRI